MRIGLVTDSNAQITRELVERFDVEVVPLTVTIDGHDHLEGVDLDADAFYATFDDRTPALATAQPPPGRFASAYAALADRGAERIVSVHLSSAMSGTASSAALAAASSRVPVEVVDTDTASFGVSVCVWAAGAAIESGADVDGARGAIDEIAPHIRTAFIAGVPHLARLGGRAVGVELDGDGIAVLAMQGGAVDVIGRAHTVGDAVEILTGYVARGTRSRTVMVGVADAPTRPLAERLRAALAGVADVDRVGEYRIGPSIGAHTGPGTFGLFDFPTIDPG